MKIPSGYHYEEVRLASFNGWPHTRWVNSPKTLAKAGFYYTGELDKVKCFECQVEIYEWVEGDSPMGDHQRWRPTCRFVRKQSCGNIPLESSSFEGPDR